MSDTYSAGSRINSQGDFEFYDKVSGTTMLAFRGPNSTANTDPGFAQLDFSLAPGGVQMPGGWLTPVKVTLTAAQVVALGASPPVPVTLIPAPAAGYSVIVTAPALFYLNHGTAPFAGGSALQIEQNSILIASTTAALINNASSIVIQAAFPGIGTTQSIGVAGAPTVLNVAGAAFTGGGTSTLDVFLWFAIVATP